MYFHIILNIYVVDICVGEFIMRKVILYILIISVFVSLLTGCDPNTGRRPMDFPNTRWVSKNPDMFFEVPPTQDEAYRGPLHGGIIKDGETFELMIAFMWPGALVSFNDSSGFDLETRSLLPGINEINVRLFTGICTFGRNRLVVEIDNNDKGFLDDSVIRIVFRREDIE